MAAGRPPKFKTPQDLQEQVDNFFDDCATNKEKPTISGLAYHLGFESRQSFYDYEKNKEFSYTIKRARLKIELCYEQQLATKWSTGAIFALKNFGWSDRQEMVHSGEIKTISGINVK